MRKVIQRIFDLFIPENLQTLDSVEIEAALADLQTRNLWIQDVFAELQRINLEVDKRLMEGQAWSLTDLSVRRRAIQDVLDMALAAKRKLKRDVRPNQEVQMSTIDLDRVTA